MASDLENQDPAAVAAPTPEESETKTDGKASAKGDGKAADPILQADDIIYVPANLVKGALKSGGASLLVSSILGFAVLSN